MNHSSRLIAVSLLLTILLHEFGCALAPPLKPEDWRNLDREERRLFFEAVLAEPERAKFHLTVLLSSVGGLLAFTSAALVSSSPRGNGPLSWIAFLSAVGIFWGGIGFFIQDDNLAQRKNVAFRELSILDHPEWKRERVRLIRDGKVDIGFNADMVKASWGKPSAVNKNVTIKDNLFEEWVYFIMDDTRVYFDLEGKVTAIQTPQKTYYKKASDQSE